MDINKLEFLHMEYIRLYSGLPQFILDLNAVSDSLSIEIYSTQDKIALFQVDSKGYDKLVSVLQSYGYKLLSKESWPQLNNNKIYVDIKSLGEDNTITNIIQGLNLAKYVTANTNLFPKNRTISFK